MGAIRFDAVSLTRLTEQEEPRRVLNLISFSWLKGEICAIVGPSGAGKSTLLRMINRLIEPDSGRIYVDGQDVCEIPVLSLRQKIGMLFQSPILFSGTVGDNICCGPRLRGEILSDPGAYLSMVGLEEGMCQRDVTQLSGGERQRVALARALANNPQILLLDEPTSALDLRSTEIIEELIFKQRQALKLTVLWVTHNLDQAKRVGDRTISLDNGVIREL